MKVGNLVTEALFGLWGKLSESTKSFTILWAIFKRKGMIKWSLTKGNVNLERMSGIYLLEEANVPSEFLHWTMLSRRLEWGGRSCSRQNKGP